jgi:hypothetical protein
LFLFLLIYFFLLSINNFEIGYFSDWLAQLGLQFPQEFWNSKEKTKQTQQEELEEQEQDENEDEISDDDKKILKSKFGTFFSLFPNDAQQLQNQIEIIVISKNLKIKINSLTPQKDLLTSISNFVVFNSETLVLLLEITLKDKKDENNNPVPVRPSNLRSNLNSKYKKTTKIDKSAVSNPNLLFGSIKNYIIYLATYIKTFQDNQLKIYNGCKLNWLNQTCWSSQLLLSGVFDSSSIHSTSNKIFLKRQNLFLNALQLKETRFKYWNDFILALTNSQPFSIPSEVRLRLPPFDSPEFVGFSIFEISIFSFFFFFLIWN